MRSTRTCLGVCRLLFLFLLPTLLMAQAPKTSPPQAPPQAATGSAVELPQEEAFAQLKELNDEQKLIVTMMGPATYNELKPKNCGGWRLSNGLRLLWESSGEGYGLTMTVHPKNEAEKTYHAIGVIYTEADLRIGAKALRPGAYMVYASAEEFRLEAEKSEESEAVREIFPLPNKLAAGEFEKGKKTPRFTFAQRKEGLFLTIGENSFAVLVK